MLPLLIHVRFAQPIGVSDSPQRLGWRSVQRRKAEGALLRLLAVGVSLGASITTGCADKSGTASEAVTAPSGALTLAPSTSASVPAPINASMGSAAPMPAAETIPQDGAVPAPADAPSGAAPSVSATAASGPAIGQPSTSAAGGASVVLASDADGSTGDGGAGGNGPNEVAEAAGTGGMMEAEAAASGGSAAAGSGGGPPLSAGPSTLWIAGDSTVANGNTPCPVGWGKRIAERFDDAVTVVNSAVGGRSVRTWIYFVGSEMDGSGECVLERDGAGEPLLQDRWLAMLDGMQAGDTLLIQFGINDGSATCDRHVGLDAFKETYGVLALAAKERDAQPVFITPVSMIKCSGSQAVGSRGAYVDATFEAGSQFDVPVFDLHQASVDLYQELGFCPIPGGDVSEQTGGDVGAFFCDDHTHFDDSGAEQIAALVARGLADLNLPVAGHLL